MKVDVVEVHGIWDEEDEILKNAGLLMAFHKHCSALLDDLNRKEVPIETTPQEILSLIGVEASSHPLLTFFDEELPLEGATHIRPLQITTGCMGTKVPVALIDNGSH
ncbi:hypothetical protein SO802_002507 [Lithocarpus litseifolius]|uniref:Uncharacterized protein n=1 Tax=Lithocarpus litseifolius TaxID=425828 RepID=A0AAW2DXR3_9ROSI